jgi:pimeloyl-ACP methyl ester carboxylesterase
VAVYVAGATTLVLFVSSLAVLDAERDAERASIVTFPDALWWAMTTVTTVGYGDFFPVTRRGRMVAGGLMLAGIALLGVVTASLASWLIDKLAQPSDLPERMIGADPDVFFGHFLDAWTVDPAAIPADVRAAYLAAARTPEAIRAVCHDYRADAFVDAEHDAQDQQAGRQLTMPVLAMWEDPGDTPLPFDPQQIWARWAPDLRCQVRPGGHFQLEERPHDVVAAIRDLISPSVGASGRESGPKPRPEGGP